MEHLDEETLLARLKLANTRYETLLQQSRGAYGEKANVESDALHELSAALEELNVTSEELRTQNEALRDAYAEVEKERTHYAELFNLVPDAYFVTDAFGTVLEANLAAEGMLNIQGDRLRGKPLAVFVAEESRKEFRTALHEIQVNDTRLEWTAIVTPRGGAPFRATMRVGRIHDSSTRQRLGWTIRDTTEKQRVTVLGQRFAEEQSARIDAERAARRFRLLAEASRNLTIENDLAATCHAIAKAVVKFAADHCEIYTLMGDQLVSQARVNREPRQAAFIDALRKRHNLSVENHDSLIYRALETLEPQASPDVNSEKRLSRKEWFAAVRAGGPRNALVLPMTSNGKAYGVIVVLGAEPSPQFSVEDIGVLIEIANHAGLSIAHARLFTEVEQANREKADFLAVLSHELRTPLTAVIGYTELLLADIPEALPPTAHSHVERIKSCSWHQLSVVEQILKYARIESGEDAAVMQEVDVQSVVIEAQQLLTIAGHKETVRLDLDLPAAPFTIRTDPNKLRQILVNLLTNAFKFTDEGAVSLSVRRNDDNVFFTITDTGIGIAAENVARVFDPFWRAERSNDSRRGMGLGLAVSDSLAHALNGEITVQSQLGVGTAFTLSLPL